MSAVERAEQLAQTARHDAQPPIRCADDSCRCTHREPCVAGWVTVERAVPPTRIRATSTHAAIDTTERVTGKTTDTAEPCRVCRPEQHELVHSGDDRVQIMAGLRARGMHAKTAAKIKQRDAQTVVDDSPWWAND